MSDIHTVGERYGFRIESGRSGPRGNERLRQTLARLQEIHTTRPLDVILLTGDLTDAGRSAEWAEFFAALAACPQLAELVVALPGNHDVNVVDRASPARMDLPTSPTKRLRQMRTISALGMLQGRQLHVVERKIGRIGGSLADVLKPYAVDIAGFADNGSARLSRSLAELSAPIFPMVLPPDTEDGHGIIVINSNAETHFSFTNALGLVSADQNRGLQGCHQSPSPLARRSAHHVAATPGGKGTVRASIGTALINGSWFIRRLLHLGGRAVICMGMGILIKWGNLKLHIVSAPSPVMGSTDDAATYFYVHTFAIGTKNQRLKLLEPERINLCGQQSAKETLL